MIIIIIFLHFQRPYLDLVVVEKRVTGEETRRKREARDDDGEDEICDENTGNTSCCRFPLLVDFSHFNWDFIIEPRQLVQQ